MKRSKKPSSFGEANWRMSETNFSDDIFKNEIPNVLTSVFSKGNLIGLLIGGDII